MARRGGDGVSEYRKQLEERDGVSRVFCLKCNTLYQDPNGYPIGFTVRYCCSQETETNQERIDFLVTYPHRQGVEVKA